MNSSVTKDYENRLIIILEDKSEKINISSLVTNTNLYKWCIDSKRYCDKYGIDHVVQTEPILKFFLTPNN